jgi:L-amino acid N-acyltransferase YncA
MSRVIRPAVPEDAEAIARIRVASWRESYNHFLSAEFLAAQDAAADVERWRDGIERGATVFVSEVDGEVRGFAHAAPAREEDAPRDWVLGLIYQLSSEHGTGSGQELLDAVVGDRPAYLWVAEENPRAIAFYRRNGFELDGARKVEPAWENLVEVRMVR